MSTRSTGLKLSGSKSNIPTDLNWFIPADTNVPVKPQGVDIVPWEVILSIKADTAANREYLSNINARIDAVEAQQSELVGDISSLQNSICELESTMKTLTGRLVRQEISNQRQQNEISDLRAYSMKYNIIINFDRNNSFVPKPNESPIGQARRFFYDVMKISKASEIYIPVAHHLGPTNNQNRPLLVKIPEADQIAMVMQHTKNLTGMRHSVSRQLPPEKRERKQYVLPILKEAKKDRNNQAKLMDERLYIKGNLQKQYLPSPLPLDVSTDVTGIVIKEGEPIEDGNSTFSGYSAPVSSLRDVRRVVDKLLQSPSAAQCSHFMYAYRISTDQVTIENYHSDCDHGVGLELLKTMKDKDITNTVFIATRACQANFKHIGSKRFEHASATCMQAHDGQSINA